MSWNKIVFEIAFTPMLIYGPYEFVDALNAIVDEYVDGDERFVVYTSAENIPNNDYLFPTIAYLDEQVVQALSERFGLVSVPVKAVPSKTP